MPDYQSVKKKRIAQDFIRKLPFLDTHHNSHFLYIFYMFFYVMNTLRRLLIQSKLFSILPEKTKYALKKTTFRIIFYKYYNILMKITILRSSITSTKEEAGV